MRGSGSLSVKKTIVTFFWVVANDWVSDQTGRDLQGRGCVAKCLNFRKLGFFQKLIMLEGMDNLIRSGL